jgi:hypothetical protein
MYLTTLHPDATQKALSLEKDVPLTVQGYGYENDDPSSKRMDALSVINVLDSPGKPGE